MEKIKRFAMHLLLVLALCGVSAMSAIAQQSVRGVVVGPDNDPLPGATVAVKGISNSAVATNLDGVFTLSLKNPANAVLTVSYVGYHTQEYPLKGQSNVKITLVEDSYMLDEIVAVGYGQAKKVSLTGSVATVTAKDLAKVPMANTSQMLVGKVAGISTVQTSGIPGSDGASVRVRGLNDFNQSGPLVLVDGVAMSMDNVNPNDIESVSVLKDASAAIYGIEGANGVILITTKKGNTGAAKITFDASVTLGVNTAMPEYLDAKEYIYYQNKARVMDGLSPLIPGNVQNAVMTNDPNTPYGQTNWLKETWRTGVTQNYNVGASGGTDKMHYFHSLGIMDQDGTMRGTSYRRYNVRSNFDVQVARNLRFVSNISGYRREVNLPYADMGFQSLTSVGREANATVPIIKKEWNGYPVAWRIGGAGTDYNPVATIANSGYRKTDDEKFIGNFTLEYDFADIAALRGLKASVNGVYTFQQTNLSSYQGYYKQWSITDAFLDEPELRYKPGYSQGGGYGKTTTSYPAWKLTPQLSYNRKFGKHDVGALFVYEATNDTYNYLSVWSSQFATENPVDISLASNINPEGVDGSHGFSSKVSYIGRLNYGYDDKYMVEFAFRRDGSYKFAPENRWGFFPSASAAWVISRENFISENLDWLDFLKLRLSYGESGKDGVDAFLFQSNFGVSTNSWVVGEGSGSTTSLFYTQNSYVYRNLKWSTTRTYNVGLDFDVLRRRLGAEIDVFYQVTDDLLESASGNYPYSLGGYYPSMANTGSVDNRGIDFTIKHNNVVNRDFNYNMRFTFGFARNKVLKKAVTDNYPNYQGVLGYSMNARFGLIALGLYQTQEQLDNAYASPSSSGLVRLGDIMYKDVNGDGQIQYKGSSSDYVRIGYGIRPEITASLNMDFNYKDFSLGLLWTGATHCDYQLLGSWNGVSSASTPYTFLFFAYGNGPKYLAEGAWTEENALTAKYPRLSTIDNGHNAVSSTWWLVNGEYLRLKTLSLGYEVPSRVLRKTPFSRLKAYVSGTNVLTFSHNKYMDPESPSINTSIYPQSQTWSFGVNVAF